MPEEYFKKLKHTLDNLNHPIDMWWRDDDVRAQHIPFYELRKLRKYKKYKKKLQNIITLLNKYHIPPIFAVIPKNYLEYGHFFTKLFKRGNVFIILHGLNHINRNTHGGTTSSEFPLYQEEDYVQIIKFYNSFKNIFGKQLLNVFCPPYNNINKTLEKKLNEAGLIVSSSNHSSINIHNIDYDFCDWSICKIKPKEQIINELCTLIKSGRKVIGINSHHDVLNLKKGDFEFFDKLFSIIDKSDKIHWINPFIQKEK